jgi:hypothetical protein
MGVLGDMRSELERIRRAFDEDDEEEDEETPDERAELDGFEARSAENLRRLRELVERGWVELRERRAAAERGEGELSPAWLPPPG